MTAPGPVPGPAEGVLLRLPPSSSQRVLGVVQLVAGLVVLVPSLVLAVFLHAPIAISVLLAVVFVANLAFAVGNIVRFSRVSLTITRGGVEVVNPKSRWKIAWSEVAVVEAPPLSGPRRLPTIVLKSGQRIRVWRGNTDWRAGFERPNPAFDAMVAAHRARLMRPSR